MRRIRDTAMRTLRRFRRSVEDARHRPEEEELRRLRVRMKRVRSLLRFLAFLNSGVDGPHGSLRRTKALFSAAGAVREMQVSTRSLERLPLAPPTRSPGIAHLASMERSLQKQLCKALARMRTEDFQRLELHALRMIGARTERELRTQARAFVRAELQEAARLARSTDVHLHLHAIRKHLKHVLHLFELVDPGAPRPAGLSDVLDGLGDWHDAVDLCAALSGLGEHPVQRAAMVTAAERRMHVLQAHALDQTASFIDTVGRPLQRRG
jgi:hypothetical protein